MSYLSAAENLARRPLTVVQLSLDNIISDAGSERFCDGNVPLGSMFEPCLDSVSYNPSKITEAGLGYRSSVTVTFQDFPHPSGRGTYFGRLIGGNPYYIDRQLVIYRGFEHAPFSLINMKKSLYFIKKIDGPDERGKVRITAADVLTKLDGEQALWPPATFGSLATALNATYTGSVNIGNNANIEASTYVMIDSEICSVSAITSTTSITISARGLYGTTAAAHDAGAPVRIVGASIGGNVVDRIYSLIDIGSPIDVATYINLTEWNYQRDNYLSLQTIYGITKEPTPVKDIISDICKQFNIAIWWDDEAQLIRLKALGPTLGTPTKITRDQHILNTGHSVTRDQSKAVSQVWVYFNKRDHSKGDDAENYASLYVYQDPSIEGAAGLGQPMIEKIMASQLPSTGLATASKIASRISSQRKAGSLECKFRLDIRDASLSVGDGVEITTDLIQGIDGENVPTNFMVTERDRKATWVEYTAIATGIEVGNRYGAICANSMTDYTSATTAQRNQYAFIASDAGLMSNSDSANLIL